MLRPSQGRRINSKEKGIWQGSNEGRWYEFVLFWQETDKRERFSTVLQYTVGVYLSKNWKISVSILKRKIYELRNIQDDVHGFEMAGRAKFRGLIRNRTIHLLFLSGVGGRVRKLRKSYLFQGRQGLQGNSNGTMVSYVDSKYLGDIFRTIEVDWTFCGRLGRRTWRPDSIAHFPANSPSTSITFVSMFSQGFDLTKSGFLSWESRYYSIVVSPWGNGNLRFLWIVSIFLL